MLSVVILSGGLATRMRPVTEKIPKSMIDVAGRPFIEWQLAMLSNQGIKNVFLCVGYLGEMIEDCVGDGARYGLNVTYSYDGDKLLGTGGAIKKIEKLLPDAFFILYGDSYLELSYRSIEEVFLASDKQGLMTVYENHDLLDSSNVFFQNGVLENYSKKNKTPDMCHIDYGLGILQKNVLQDFPKDHAFDLADVYETLVKNNQLLGYEVFNRFYEIGSPSGLSELCKKIKKEEIIV